MFKHAFRRAVLAAAVPCCLAAAPQAWAGNAEAEAAVKAFDALLVKALSSGNVDEIAKFYAGDAVFAASGVGAMKGRTAIHDGFKSLFADPNFSGTEADFVVMSDDAGQVAYSTARYTVSLSGADKKKMTMTGTNTTVYRKGADGAWMIVSDMNVDDAQPMN